MRSRAGLIPLAALGAVACVHQAPPVQIPASVPDFSSVRVDETKVTVVYSDGDAAEPEIAADYQREADSLLSDAAAKRKGAAATADAEVRVVILGGRSVYRAGAFVLPYVLFAHAFGTATTFGKISVDLTLRSDGHVFRGHGEASEKGSYRVSIRRRALAVALDQALAHGAIADP
jgi:hypothetical protein